MNINVIQILKNLSIWQPYNGTYKNTLKTFILCLLQSHAPEKTLWESIKLICSI